MPESRGIRKRGLLWALAALLMIIVILVTFYKIRTYVRPPHINTSSISSEDRKQPDTGFFTFGKGWLQQDSSGLWEMYLEGDPFERGHTAGKLTQDLIRFQEEAFIGRIREMIPSPFYLRFLRYFIYWFNRDLDVYIPEEYLSEIYGVSLSAAEQFNYIGDPYRRMLNYHSAHDIGHALQDLALVGCTSFGAWGGTTSDSSLILGRNFDFYMGDAFARNKIVAFIKPDSGYPFMMVTWAGMMGTVSGMNTEGLTITINAAKSAIPYSARTPISLLAREILQYGSTIEEAYQIAQKKETFVSESLLIGSAKENRASIIEKTPFKTVLLQPETSYIGCSNHFRSEEFREDPLNVENIRESNSLYRYRTMEGILAAEHYLDERKAAQILRRQAGLNDKVLGMGNEMAINQLIAHHSVIFKPSEQLVWVSTGPWQCGSYVCYDLKKIFHNFAGLRNKTRISEKSLEIPSDPFIRTQDYLNFLRYRVIRDSLLLILKKTDPVQMTRSFPDELLSLNPGYYEGYMLAGDIFAHSGYFDKAVGLYERALRYPIPHKSIREKIIQKMSRCLMLTKQAKNEI